jgi:hypothetical protein
MFELLLTLWFYLGPIIGEPLLAIGVILWLCEGSWGKVKGAMGSTGFIIAGILLLFPFAAYLVWGLLS